MRIILFVLLQFTFSGAIPAGGKCETSADCVAPNVCSKWGWCQWTKIYGEDGPTQGASAPGGGRAGQCKTSADCASRVPYCSKLGYCHGGRLPFDEEQIEISGSKDAQGFINNNPSKNSPSLQSGTNRSPTSPETAAAASSSTKDSKVDATSGDGNGGCPGGSIETCVDNACVPLKAVDAYGVCVTECGKRCPE